jgi:hypothetical protein
MGFYSRLKKARKREIVYRCDCPVKLAFREQTDPNHISLVATITFSGDLLKPMFLTSAVPDFTGPSTAELASDIMVCRTVKGYQIHESMFVYLRDALAPCSQGALDEMKDQTLPIFIILDNCECHKKDIFCDVDSALNLLIIWLPPDFSHFLQPLNLMVFARLSMRYQEQQAVKTKPKCLSKIIRIHRIWHEYAHRLTVRAAWATAAVIHTPPTDWAFDFSGENDELRLRSRKWPGVMFYVCDSVFANY